MGLLIDTSVWSLAFRRDTPPGIPEVAALRQALVSRQQVSATGVILLELLQGALPAKAQQAIRSSFEVIDVIVPTVDDYVEAAALSNECRRNGIRLETVDSLTAQLAIKHQHALLTTDRDFTHAAKHIPLKLWTPAVGA